MNNHKLILAHFSEAELASLDLLQGGPSFDDELKIREYSALATLFDNPQYLEILDNSFKQIIEDKGNIKPALHNIKNYLGNEQLEFIPAPGDEDPQILALSQKGLREDTKIAYVPLNVANTLSIYMGYKINPETGLREFFAFLAPLLGALGSGLGAVGGAVASGAGALASGIGGALASGIGSMFAPAAIGSSAATAFGSGGLGGLLSHLGTQIPSMLTSFGANYGLSRLMGANHGMASKMGFYNGVLPGLMENTLPGAENNLQLKNDKENNQNNAQNNANTINPYSQLSKNILQMSMIQDFAKRDRERREEQRRNYNKELNSLNPFNNIDIGAIKIDSDESQKPESVISRYNPYKFKQGGNIKDSYLIDGYEDGQKDNRSHRLKEGDFIINATVVSSLGSGNTKAGTSALNNFFKTIGKYKDGKKVRSVPVLLSDGEYKVDRDRVNALGKGSNDKGVYLLKKLQKNVLHHSASKKGKLPPAAKKIQDYF